MTTWNHIHGASSDHSGFDVWLVGGSTAVFFTIPPLSPSMAILTEDVALRHNFDCVMLSHRIPW